MIAAPMSVRNRSGFEATVQHGKNKSMIMSDSHMINHSFGGGAFERDWQEIMHEEKGRMKQKDK